MSRRRGSCPTLAAPMATGDGLLARMKPILGGMTPATLAAIAEAAGRFGNGLLEVTARGSLQIRGLTLESAPRLAAAVDLLDIPIRSGVPVETGPLAGLDPEEVIDPRPLAEDIRDRIAATGLSQRLGPKVSVVVDGGGGLKLDTLVADVRLIATGGGWRVAIGGTATTAAALALVSETDAAATVVAILEAVASKGRSARAKELSLEELRSTLPPSVLPDISPSRGEIGCGGGRRVSCNVPDSRNPSGRPISPLEGEMSGRTEGGNVERIPIGTFPLSDARVALGIGLPFGQTTAEQIISFAEAAERHGVGEIRPAPGRALLALMPAEAAVPLKQIASGLGFITVATDPRLSVVACAGAPACASGHIQSRAIASEIAADAAAILGDGQLLHVSGCAKQCAKPARAAFTLVGTASGAELHAGNGVAGEPITRVANNAAAAAFRRAGERRRREKNTGDGVAGTRQGSGW